MPPGVRPPKNAKTPMREVLQPVFRLASSIRTMNDRLLAKRLGITLSQFKILSALAGNPKTSQRVVADFWFMTEASISRQVEILHAKKMLSKLANPRSRREHLLKLTARGEKTIQKARRLIDASLETTFRGITEKERVEFSLLVKLLLSLMPEREHPAK